MLTLLATPGLGLTVVASNNLVTEEMLYRALTKLSINNERGFQLILQQNERLVTRRVWQWLTTEALFLQRQGLHSACLQRSIAALHLALFLQAPDLVGSSYQRLGRYYFEAGNVKLAVDSYLASARYFERVHAKRPTAFVYSELALVYVLTSRLELAESFANKALGQIESSITPDSAFETVPLEKARAVATTVLAEVALQNGQYEAALSGFVLALDVYVALDTVLPGYGVLLTEAYTDVGRAHLEMGDHRNAMVAFLQALSIASDRKLEGAEADVYRFLGLLHLKQDNYDRAEGDFLTSVGLFEKVGDSATLRKVLVNLGVLYLRQRELGKALHVLRRAELLSPGTHTIETKLLIDQNLGALYHAEGKTTLALRYLSRSELAAKRAGLRLRVAEALLRKAQVFMSQREYKKASEVANTAFGMAADLHADSLMNNCAIVLADAAVKNGYPENAYLTLLAATARIEQMRERLMAQPADLAPFFARNAVPFQILVELSVKRQKFFEALEFADRAKGRVLLDLFQDERVKTKDVLSDVEQEDDRRLGRELSELRQQLNTEQSKPKQDRERISRLTSRLKEARLMYASFRDSLIVAHPELRAKSAMPARITSKSLSQLIPDSRTAILEYVVTDDRVISFVVRRRSPVEDPEVHVYSRVISREAITRIVSDLREV